MKRFFALAALSFSIFILPGVSFAAEIYEMIYYDSVSDLVEGKAIYDMAFFNQVEFYVGVDGYLSEQEKSYVGYLAIPNGVYHYFDADDNRIDVNGESKTFDLIKTYEEPDYTEFSPAINGSNVFFKGAADGGLQGKQYSYNLLGVDSAGYFPNFRTFGQQMATYVPYIERDSSGRNYTFRMVNPRNTGVSLSVPSSGRYRIRMRDEDGNTIFRSDWKTSEAGADPAYSVTLPNDVDAQSIRRIIVDAQLDEDSAYNRYSRYGWRFDVCDRTNSGIVDDSALNTPVSINVGEEAEIRIAFKDGYRGSTTTSYRPIIITDRTVLENDSWTYDTNTKEGVFRLRGLKDGRTTFSVAYYGEESGWYHTAFTEVIVGSGGSGGGGGGCSVASGGMFAILALGATVFSSKKRGEKI
jgi:hypothetical protein